MLLLINIFSLHHYDKYFHSVQYPVDDALFNQNNRPSFLSVVTFSTTIITTSLLFRRIC